MQDIFLTQHQATSVGAIQQAIDSLESVGGRVVLPEMELILDRGIELRSNVELIGQGEKTVLQKAPGRIYPLSGYHNYGMLDVPLQYTDGLQEGMTVSLRDDRHGGFFETFARITWVEGNWVGIDTGLHADYHAELNPFLVTAFPLVYGLEISNSAVRNLTLDGNRAQQPAGIGSCRGAAVYFLRSSHIEVSDVTETSFMGEGLGFQMCSHLAIRNCWFENNSGNGYHPGAGSTAVLFENCVGTSNDGAGFFFCVRANHITVKNCTFSDNVHCGISVGTRDNFNMIDKCCIKNNAGPGLLFRTTKRPVEVKACRVSRCLIQGNGTATGNGQIDVLGDAHDLIFEHNSLKGRADEQKAGIFLASSTERVWLEGNQIQDCFPAVIAGDRNLAGAPLDFECGIDAVKAQHFRHLTYRSKS